MDLRKQLQKDAVEWFLNLYPEMYDIKFDEDDEIAYIYYNNIMVKKALPLYLEVVYNLYLEGEKDPNFGCPRWQRALESYIEEYRDNI